MTPRRAARAAALCLGALSIAAAHAQATSDLALSIALQPEKSVYHAGDTVQLRFEVSNAGPDASPNPAVELDPQGPDAGIVLQPAEGDGCLAYPIFVYPYVRWVITYPALAPGARLACSMDARVLPSANGSHAIRAQVLSTFPPPGSYDPQPANDIATRSLAFAALDAAPAAIPADAWWGSLLLCAALLWAAPRSTAQRDERSSARP